MVVDADQVAGLVAEDDFSVFGSCGYVGIVAGHVCSESGAAPQWAAFVELVRLAGAPIVGAVRLPGRTTTHGGLPSLGTTYKMDYHTDLRSVW